MTILIQYYVCAAQRSAKEMDKTENEKGGNWNIHRISRLKRKIRRSTLHGQN